MDASLAVKALIAGIFFGLWPLFMNRSGLNGNVASIAFTIGVLVCVTPFAIGSLRGLEKTDWNMAIAASIVGAIGLLLFNVTLSKATPQNVSTYFAVMILAQVSVPAVYNIIVTGKLTASKGLGFLLAIISGVLLAL